MYKVSSYIEQHGTSGDDSLELLQLDDCILFCIADGAGGSAGAKEASKLVTQAAKELIMLQEFTNPDDFEGFLRKLDLEVSTNPSCGETTAIVGTIKGDVVVGASCGDSEAWIYSEKFDYELTGLQYNKPLIGSRKATPIGFGPLECSNLVIGSDGLFKYADRNQIKEHVMSKVAKSEDIAALAKKETGELQDDISVILLQRQS